MYTVFPEQSFHNKILYNITSILWLYTIFPVYYDCTRYYPDKLFTANCRTTLPAYYDCTQYYPARLSTKSYTTYYAYYDYITQYRLNRKFTTKSYTYIIHIMIVHNINQPDCP